MKRFGRSSLIQEIIPEIMIGISPAGFGLAQFLSFYVNGLIEKRGPACDGLSIAFGSLPIGKIVNFVSSRDWPDTLPGCPGNRVTRA